MNRYRSIPEGNRKEIVTPLHFPLFHPLYDHRVPLRGRTLGLSEEVVTSGLLDLESTSGSSQLYLIFRYILEEIAV